MKSHPTTHKPLVLTLLFIFCMVVWGAVGITPRSVTLAWDPSTSYVPGVTDTNAAYRIYTTTNVEFVVKTNGSNVVSPASLGSWTLLTNVPASVTSVTIPILPGRYFFYATYYDPSNFWAESDPSNPALLPEPPQSGRNLRIKMGSGGQ